MRYKSKRFGKYIRIDHEMTWPAPDLDDANEHECLEWRLRYGKPLREDLLMAASFIAAYNSLVYSTHKKRNYICSAIKFAMNKRGPTNEQ